MNSELSLAANNGDGVANGGSATGPSPERCSGILDAKDEHELENA